MGMAITIHTTTTMGTAFTGMANIIMANIRVSIMVMAGIMGIVDLVVSMEDIMAIMANITASKENIIVSIMVMADITAGILVSTKVSVVDVVADFMVMEGISALPMHPWLWR